MDREDIEKPELVEKIGPFEGLKVSKGPNLLSPPEALDEAVENEKRGLYSRLRSVLQSDSQE